MTLSVPRSLDVTGTPQSPGPFKLSPRETRDSPRGWACPQLPAALWGRAAERGRSAQATQEPRAWTWAGPSCLRLRSVPAGQGAASDRSSGCIVGGLSYCQICLHQSCPSVLPLRGGQRAAPGGQHQGAASGAGATGLRYPMSAQQGRLGTPRTRASSIDASDAPSFHQRAPPCLSLSSAPSPPASQPACCVSPPLILPAVLLGSKRLSFGRRDGVWGEEASGNDASGGFYVCEGGIDHPAAAAPSSFFLFAKFITFLVLEKHSTRVDFSV